ncbi:MAG: bifunctional phosphoglucose/phosphomannose isomerase [Calditrichaceae bacterium]
MYSVDKSNFKKILLDFYKQIEISESIVDQALINIEAGKIQKILYFGMGGSAIAGNLLYDSLFDQLKAPIDVVRGYYSPAYCDENTLVIVSSYSGNTEETLSAVKNVMKTKASVLAITSGGELKKIAQSENWSLITIPGGLPPREALGYSFFPLYHTLGRVGLISKYQPESVNIADFVHDIAKRNDHKTSDAHVMAEKLAKTIKGKIPIIYSTAPYLNTISRRWQNQFHENSKSMAFANVVPEMNHNEIVGWEQDIDLQKKMIVIFLEDKASHPRIDKRIELTKKIIKKKGAEVVELYTHGRTLLEKIFSLIVLGDWVSYYLAIYYQKDPIAIKNIEYLKGELAKL